MKEMRFVFVFLFCLIPFFSSAKIPANQSTHPRMTLKEKKLWRKAEAHYTYSEYDQALPLYSQLIVSHPENALLNFQEGICLYYSSTSKPLSVSYFEKAIKLSKRDTSADLLLHMGLAYLAVNRFSDAEVYFNDFKRKDPQHNNSALLNKLIWNCENGKKFWAKPSKTRIYNLGPEVNSIYSDYSEVFTADFSSMLFTSRRKGTTGGKRDEGEGYYEDVYFSKKLDNRWSEAQRYDTTYKPEKFANLRLYFGKSENVKEINTNKHDASICMSPDGQKFYVYRKDDIWVTELVDNKWQKPTKLDKSIDYPKSFEPSAFFSKDGKTIFFVSDRKGGWGGKDIYTSTLDANGKWGLPENMGGEINSNWNEDSPYLTDDGKTLYFSSEGHNSMGGYDVFKTQKLADGTWSTPENLGAPINNGDDDVFFVPDEIHHRAWYTTLNKNGEGGLDIYQILYYPDVNPIAKLRINSTEKSAEKMSVHLREISGSFDSTFLASASDSIIYPYRPDSKYEITISGGGFQTFTETVHFSPSDSGNAYLQQLNLSKFERINQDGKWTEEKFEMNNYSFDVDNLFDSTKAYDLEHLPANRAIAMENLSSIHSPTPFTVSTITDIHADHINTVDLQKPIVVLPPGIVYFDFDQSIIRPDMVKVVDNVAVWLKNNPTETIEISGYSDDKGSDDYNIQLSEKRAQSVRDYLVGKGLNKKRVIIKANGKASPTEANKNPDGSDNPLGREKNRRVEIRLIR